MSSQLAVVLGRNYASRLGMIRAAGMAGCQVAVVKTDKKNRTASKKEKIDLKSKYVVQYFCVKEPDDQGLVKLLMDHFGNAEVKTVLLPTDDYTASVIDKNSDLLRERFVFPNIGYEQGKVVYFMNKAVQKELAIKAGLNVAKGWTAVYRDGSYVIDDGVEYPCFIKPNESYAGDKHFMQSCNSMEELMQALSKVAKKSKADVLIEQYVSVVKEYAALGYANKTEVCIPAMITADSMYLGVTATGTIQPISAFGDVGEKLKKLIGGLGFTGLFDIDLYQDDAGKIYFNEINMRFGASGYAVTNSGSNLPEMLIRELTGSISDGISQEEIRETATFANEKVCFQKLISGQFKREEFEETLRNASFGFIQCPDDKVPYGEFKKQVRAYRVKNRLRRLLGR